MIDARKWLRKDIGAEFEEAKLGDARRRSRLQLIARAAEFSPSAGFPKMVESDGELEGIYRFFGNEAVSANAILEPHIAATMERARQAELCLVVHDTTDFVFSGDRDGLGLMSNNSSRGFYAHFAMAVLPGPERIPLGVCGLGRISRQIRKNTDRKNHSDHTAKDPNRESLRWLRVVDSIESRRDGFECIHVMDREGDMFDLMALALRLDTRFVIRSGRDRALANDMGSVQDLLSKTVARAHRETEVSKRVPKRRELIAPRRGAARKQRTAKLASAVTLWSSVAPNPREVALLSPRSDSISSTCGNRSHREEKNPLNGCSLRLSRFARSSSSTRSLSTTSRAGSSRTSSRR